MPLERRHVCGGRLGVRFRFRVDTVRRIQEGERHLELLGIARDLLQQSDLVRRQLLIRLQLVVGVELSNEGIDLLAFGLAELLFHRLQLRGKRAFVDRHRASTIAIADKAGVRHSRVFPCHHFGDLGHQLFKEPRLVDARGPTSILNRTRANLTGQQCQMVRSDVAVDELIAASVEHARLRLFFAEVTGADLQHLASFHVRQQLGREFVRINPQLRFELVTIYMRVVDRAYRALMNIGRVRRDGRPIALGVVDRHRATVPGFGEFPEFFGQQQAVVEHSLHDHHHRHNEVIASVVLLVSYQAVGPRFDVSNFRHKKRRHPCGKRLHCLDSVNSAFA